LITIHSGDLTGARNTKKRVNNNNLEEREKRERERGEEMSWENLKLKNSA